MYYLLQLSNYKMTDTLSDGVSLISRHATDHNILIFARHFLQSFNVERSKGHIICGCAQDYGWLAVCVTISP